MWCITFHSPNPKLTPADAQVDFEVVPLRKHSDDQEVVEVDAFHQQPVAVGHDAVLHHHHGDATVNRCLKDRRQVYSINNEISNHEISSNLMQSIFE